MLPGREEEVVHSFRFRRSLGKIGTLRYSGRGRGGRQPEVKCSILGIISIMPQRRPEVATVKTRSLAAS